MFNVEQSFLLRNFFVFKKQCELSCPKSVRNVSGLSRNARLISHLLTNTDFPFRSYLICVYNCDVLSFIKSFPHSSFHWVIFRIFCFPLFILQRYLTKSRIDQLPDGLIAQLVEHCTSN